MPFIIFCSKRGEPFVLNINKMEMLPMSQKRLCKSCLDREIEKKKPTTILYKFMKKIFH